MINSKYGNEITARNNYFNDPLKDNPSDETTDEKILSLNANHMLRCEPSKVDLNNPEARLENERSTRLKAWAELRGYTYHPAIQVWMNDMKEIKTQEDLENELATFQSPKENSSRQVADDFLIAEDFQSTSNSISSTCTTTTSSIGSVLRTHQPISVNDEMKVLENVTMGFAFDPTSGNWINDYGITLTPEELSFNIEENKNQEKIAANLNINQFAKETLCIREQREKNEARLAKEMAAGLGCSFAYPSTEFLPISVKLETLDLYHQQIKTKYHQEASSLIEAGKLCGYVYRSQMDYWEHYISGKILNSDQLLKKYWIEGKTQLKNAGEF